MITSGLYYLIGEPFITSVSRNLAIQFQEIILTCHYNSKTNATVSWLKEASNGGNVTISSDHYFNSTTLVIQNADLQDSMTYFCNVTNEFGSNIYAVNVTVIGKLFKYTLINQN